MITYVILEDFLNHSNTFYPVTINPSIAVANTITNIDDTFVMKQFPNNNYYFETYMRIGKFVSGNNFTAGKCYCYGRHYSLPTLPVGCIVSSSKLE